MRAWQGPAVFSFGFRPFFLAAAVWAAFDSLAWTLAYLYGLPAPFADRDWHVHEMLFGYLSAVIAGFLLTAVPNWTGRLPVVGWPLAVLFLIWAAGRAATLVARDVGLAAHVLDWLFFAALAGVVWREVLNRRNVPVCLLASLLALAHVAFDLAPLLPGRAPAGESIGIATVALLVALIGGRITPSFTRNWMAKQRLEPEPAPTDRFDAAALAIVAVALGLWLAMPGAAVAGWGLVAGGIAIAARLARWRGWAVWREPLLLVLHLGYLWLAVALAMIGVSTLAPSIAPPSAGIHALTAGAFGVMTLAVMTRASRGHTGRALEADRWTQAIFVLVNLGAFGRVLAAFAPEFAPAAYGSLLLVSALLWSGGFLLFAAIYGPWLLSPKTQG